MNAPLPVTHSPALPKRLIDSITDAVRFVAPAVAEFDGMNTRYLSSIYLRVMARTGGGITIQLDATDGRLCLRHSFAFDDVHNLAAGVWVLGPACVKALLTKPAKGVCRTVQLTTTAVQVDGNAYVMPMSDIEGWGRCVQSLDHTWNLPCTDTSDQRTGITPSLMLIACKAFKDSPVRMLYNERCYQIMPMLATSSRTGCAALLMRCACT